MRISGYVIGVLLGLTLVGCSNPKDNEPEQKPKTEAEKRKERWAQQEAEKTAKLNAPVNSKNCKDYQTKYSAQDNLGYFIYTNNFNCVQKSIESGAEVNKKASRRLFASESEQYPIFLALSYSYSSEVMLKLLEILVRNGADLGIKNEQGNTAFEQLLKLDSSRMGTLLRLHETRFVNLLVDSLGKYRLNSDIPGVNERLLTWLVSLRVSANTIQSVINKGASKSYNLTYAPGKSLLDLVVANRYTEQFCLSLFKSGAQLTDYYGTLGIAMERKYHAFISEVVKKQKSLQNAAVVRAMIYNGKTWLDHAEQLVNSNPNMDLSELTNENLITLIRFDRMSFLDKFLARTKNTYNYSKNSCTNDPLNYAVLNEKLAAVKKLVENGYDLNKPKCLSLEVAIRYLRSEKVFDYVVSKTNFLNNSEANELIVKAKNVQMLDKMIKAGADINAVGSNGKTVLDNVLDSRESQGSDVSVPLKMISLNAKFSEAAILSAVRNGNVGLIKALIAKGADVKKIYKHTGSQIKFGDVPLLFYAKSAEVMQVLIDAGASPYDLTGDGGSILHYVVREQFINSSPSHAIATLKLLQFLSRFDSLNWNKTDPWGYSLITCLLANLNKRRNYNDDIIEFLISKGVDVNARTEKSKSTDEGLTALHLATHLSTVEILLKAGADKNIVNKNNQRPLVQAEALLAEAKKSLNDTEKTLKSYEADIEAAYAKGDEAMIRSKRESIEIYRKGLKEQAETYQMSLKMTQLLN